MLFYLTYWFPRSYLAKITACFMIANPLSFVVGGPLSSALLRMDGVAGLHGWQWIFLVEGIPAVLLALVVLKFLADSPARATWLTDQEKMVIAARLATDEPAGRPDLWPPCATLACLRSALPILCSTLRPSECICGCRRS